MEATITAQISDSIRFLKETWTLAGVAGDNLHSFIETLPFVPVMTSTANWRGHTSCFEVDDEQLSLQQLIVGVPEDARSPDGRPPVLFGTTPGESGPHGVRYTLPTPLPLPFSGGILIGQRFIREMYAHMGFHPAWKYDKVAELIFEGGRLQAVSDVSEEMRQIRAKASSLELRSPATSTEVNAWIQEAFSLNYTR